MKKSSRSGSTSDSSQEGGAIKGWQYPAGFSQILCPCGGGPDNNGCRFACGVRTRTGAGQTGWKAEYHPVPFRPVSLGLRLCRGSQSDGRAYAESGRDVSARHRLRQFHHQPASLRSVAFMLDDRPIRNNHRCVEKWSGLKARCPHHRHRTHTGWIHRQLFWEMASGALLRG